MNDERMQVIMGLIMHGGNAKGYAFQAIQDAKNGDFDEANKKINLANEELKEAHDTQTAMLTQEAQGNHVDIDLYMVHGQDHLMTAITYKDLAIEIIELLRRLDHK